MTWKNGRRLATFTNGDVSASFDYDADGLRTTKTVGTRRVDYYRAGGLLLGEVHTDGDESYTINYMYDESGRMLGFRLDGAEYYYVRDYSGDVTGLINARGELIGSYLYDPWGVLLETYLNTFEEETSEWTDADRAEYMRVLNLNPIRYKSYYYDTETGFYYLQSRYYDPITTRFINADGLISTGTGVLGYNMFAYCNNNPIMFEDQSGTRAFPVMVDLNNNKSNKLEPEEDIILYSEHSKKGTTNPGNRNKHENGQARKNRDNRGEKGDARRSPNPNKRHNNDVISNDGDDGGLSVGEKVLSGIIIGVSVLTAIYVVANDFTGFGIADDAAVVPLIGIIWDRAAEVFS